MTCVRSESEIREEGDRRNPISMAVPTIALYASPPSSVISAPHPCQINAHAAHDIEFGSRSSSSAASTSKPVAGGLSCLFSSHSVRHASSASSSSFSGGGEELGSRWLDRGEELSCGSGGGGSLRYSPSKFRDQSPVSVFHGPVSCSPPMRVARERGSAGGESGYQSSFRGGSSGLFNGFVRGALGSSCVDYDSRSFHVRGEDLDLGLSGIVDELTFNSEDGFSECNSGPYAKDLLRGAQLKHKIFCDEFVVKAFYEAEKAHRGQVSFLLR